MPVSLLKWKLDHYSPFTSSSDEEEIPCDDAVIMTADVT
jgi:hypothetical protein